MRNSPASLLEGELTSAAREGKYVPNSKAKNNPPDKGKSSVNVIVKAQAPQAASLLQQRREVRRSLIAWSLHRHPHLPPAPHHRLLLERLQALTEGTLVHPKTGDSCRNLMILMPPGSAKSTYTSVDFPPWYL